MNRVRIRRGALVLGVIAGLVSVPAISETGVEYLSLSNLRDENREMLPRIGVGMSREEVLRKMGNKEANTKHGNPVRNPFRIQQFSGTDGVEYEALLYYTERHAKFGKVRDSNCTPVIVSAGKVVGVGKPLLRKLRGW